MADIVKEILAKPIQLADHVTKAAEDVYSNKQECAEIRAKTDQLATLLRQAARAVTDLYERPTRRIIEDTEQILDKALTLIMKCKASGISRIFTIIPTATLRKTSQQLENSIGDVTWLLQVTSPASERDDDYVGLPPIASNEPILCLIWEQIAILCSGSIEERTDAANSLVSLARDNDRYGKLIIEEGGVVPLLKLAKEGKNEGQENVARAIGLLGRDPESVEQIVNAGVCSVFVKILKEGSMKVQIVVAWAVSELAAHHPKCQDHFAQNNIIRLLVGHLAFETVQEHSKYAITSKQQGMSIHTLVMSNKNANATINPHNDEEYEQLLGTSKVSHPMGNDNPSKMQNLVTTLKGQSPQQKHQTNPAKTNHHHNNQRPIHHHHQHSHSQKIAANDKMREAEDPETKAQMKAMAARALLYLCSGNVTICRSVTESRALLCFAILLEKGQDEVQYNSAMALMEITAVAEQNSDLRRNAFKPTAPAAKAVVDQLLRIINNADSDLLIPCIRALGHLARTFRATETRMIGPLVLLLDEREAEVTKEALVALSKFACTENFLHVNHSKAIIEAGGSKHLIQIVYFGELIVQVPALVLLCYVAMHVPDSEVLAQEEVLMVLEWASKQAPLTQDPDVDELLTGSKEKLELYQKFGTRTLY